MSPNDTDSTWLSMASVSKLTKVKFLVFSVRRKAPRHHAATSPCEALTWTTCAGRKLELTKSIAGSTCMGCDSWWYYNFVSRLVVPESGKAILKSDGKVESHRCKRNSELSKRYKQRVGLAQLVGSSSDS